MSHARAASPAPMATIVPQTPDTSKLLRALPDPKITDEDFVNFQLDDHTPPPSAANPSISPKLPAIALPKYTAPLNTPAATPRNGLNGTHEQKVSGVAQRLFDGENFRKKMEKLAAQEEARRQRKKAPVKLPALSGVKK